jgi:hypothetical protein
MFIQTNSSQDNLWNIFYDKECSRFYAFLKLENDNYYLRPKFSFFWINITEINKLIGLTDPLANLIELTKNINEK